jgi:hypothetical protein
MSPDPKSTVASAAEPARTEKFRRPSVTEF